MLALALALSFYSNPNPIPSTTDIIRPLVAAMKCSAVCLLLLFAFRLAPLVRLRVRLRF